MSKVGNNIVTQGLSGMLGNQLVFRIRGSHTYVSKAPVKKERELSEAQILHQRKWQEAILYGKGAMASPEMKEAYKASADETHSAYNVAVADFMNAPHIDEINISQYTGQPGSFITVRAVDDFSVAEVTVTIYNPDGTLVEQGNAVAEAGGALWKYTATAANTDLSGDKIVIKVSDIPGNLTQDEKLI
jgi:threonine dehydratase